MPLAAVRCNTCSLVHAPVAQRCPRCGSEALSRALLPDEGELLSWTVVHAAPEGVRPGYVVGIIRVGDVLLLARGPSVEGLEIGAPVRLSTTPPHLVFHRS